jgi:hypothetical protein
MHVFPDDFAGFRGLLNLNFAFKFSKEFADRLFCERIFLSVIENSIFLNFGIQGHDCYPSLDFIPFNLLSEVILELADFALDCFK